MSVCALLIAPLFAGLMPPGYLGQVTFTDPAICMGNVNNLQLYCILIPSCFLSK